VRVEAFDQLLRRAKPLGKPTRTDKTGAYRLTYKAGELEPQDKGAADVLVRVFGDEDKLLGQSSVFFNAGTPLEADINLSPVPYLGPSEFESALEAVRTVAGNVPLWEITEDSSHQDITFLTDKTGLSQAVVSALAMAFRFEKSARVSAVAYYALLRQGPAQNALKQPAAAAPSLSFEAQAKQAFSTLMSEPIATLMASIKGAIAANVIPYAVTVDLPQLERALVARIAAYQKANPPPTSPSTLTQKLSIAGLQGSQVSTVSGRRAHPHNSGGERHTHRSGAHHKRRSRRADARRPRHIARRTRPGRRHARRQQHWLLKPERRVGRAPASRKR
jgi:hypothetical protein